MLLELVCDGVVCSDGQCFRGGLKKPRWHLHEDEVTPSTSTSERYIKIARKDSTPSPDPLILAILRSFQSKLKKNQKTNMYTSVSIPLKTLLKNHIFQRY